MPANGIKGRFDLTANIPTTVSQCETLENGVVVVNVCNRGNASTLVKMAVTSIAGQFDNNAHYIEYDVELGPKGVLVRDGITINEDQFVVVSADSSAVSVVSWGVEYAAAQANPNDPLNDPEIGSWASEPGDSFWYPGGNRMHTYNNLIYNIGNVDNDDGVNARNGRMYVYNTNGEFVYGTRIENQGNSEPISVFTQTDIDDSGNLYAVGRHKNGTTSSAIGTIIRKINTSGGEAWSKHVREGFYSGGDGWFGDGNAVAYDPNNSVVFVAGNTERGSFNSDGARDPAIVCLNASDGSYNNSIGNVAFTDTSNLESRITKMKIAPNGYLYVLRYENNATPGSDRLGHVTVMDVNNSYSVVWDTSMYIVDNNGNENVVPKDIVFDSSSNAYVYLHHNTWDPCVTKLNSSGVHQWTRSPVIASQTLFQSQEPLAIGPNGDTLIIALTDTQDRGWVLEMNTSDGNANWQFGSSAPDYQFQGAVVVGDKLYLGSYETPRVFKVNENGGLALQTTSDGATISDFNYGWSAPGTEANVNIQVARSITHAAVATNTITLDTSYAGPDVQTINTTYNIITPVTSSNVSTTVTVLDDSIRV